MFGFSFDRLFIYIIKNLGGVRYSILTISKIEICKGEIKKNLNMVSNKNKITNTTENYYIAKVRELNLF